MNDEVFLVEKDGRIVVIESPCFYDNITELESYIDILNAKVEGVLLSYHSAGASFQPKAKNMQQSMLMSIDIWVAERL